MNRREFIKHGAGALAATALAGKSRAATGKPNIVLIMADDLGYECLGCYGGTSYSTPNLDKLAATGVRFDHCYSQPLCTPSRVKIMTGRHNFRNYKVFGMLDPKEKTFAHVLRKAGYSTCAAGKWQLYGRSEGWVGAGSTPGQAGFDRYCLWQIKERDSRYWDPKLKIDDKPLDVYEDEYGPDVFCDYIRNYIEKHKNGPFFIYYPMCLTHSPFLPTPDTPGAQDKRNRQDTAYFADMVAYMDKAVGRIVDKLDELGIRDNTLVLFTGDNGSPMGITSKVGDRIIHGGKSLTTDAGTHVALVANWQGVTPAGAVCDDLVDFSDFLPTLAEAGGAALPRDVTIDGRSFLPQLKGQKGNPREWIFVGYPGKRPYKHDRLKPRRFARDKRWKLYGDGRFFDIKNDPLEENPLDVAELAPEPAAAYEKFEKVLASYA